MWGVLMFDLSKPFAFERLSNILSFSRNTLPVRNDSIHLYIPWSTDYEMELMFKIKKHLIDSGNCFIPFCDLNLNVELLSSEHMERVNSQLEDCVETHLIMSGADSIHIFKVKSLATGELSHKMYEKTIDCFRDASLNKGWVEVSDLFVYKASHNRMSSTDSSLRDLIYSNQTENYFTPLQKINIENTLNEESNNWIETQRDLTYDYFLRGCELEANIFQDSWNDLSHSSRHFLISFKQLRHKALLCKDKQKIILLRESFESYLSALLNELNEVYIAPLTYALSRYTCLQDSWSEVKSGLINPDLKVILEKIYAREDKQLTSLEDFVFFFKNVKSFLFSLNSRFAKKIGKEEHLIVDTFLSKQENMIDSLLSRGFHKKVEFLVIVKDWLFDLFEDIESIPQDELKLSSLKLAHILSMISSTNYDDNIFFKILEEKTAKGFVKRSFEDEVKCLISKREKASA